MLKEPSSQQVEAIKAEHPKAVGLEVDGQTFIAKPAPRVVYAQYLNALTETRKGYDAYAILCKHCIVFPDEVDRDELFDATPGLIPALGAQIAKLCETEAKVTVKKL